MSLEKVADIIRKATKGLFQDHHVLVDAVLSVPPKELPHLQSTFLKRHGKSVVKVVEKAVGGPFGKLLVGTLQVESVFAAISIHSVLKGSALAKENMLIDTLIGRTNLELDSIKKAFHDYYQKDLVHVLEQELTGHDKTFFVLMLQTHRDDSGAFTNVKEDVETLFKVLQQEKSKEDENGNLAFIKIVLTRHEAHLAKVFDAVAEKSSVCMLNLIKKRFAGPLQTILLAVLDYVESPGMFYAKQLKAAMAGAGMDEEKVHRMILRIRGTPAQQWTIDAYQKAFGKSLIERVKSEASGNHQELLEGLLLHPIDAS
jgi:annexin A7/11